MPGVDEAQAVGDREVRLGRCVRAAVALWLAGMSAVLADEALVARGEYLVKAGACASCHTNVPDRGAWLAGGRELPTPYGTFIAPNITPDPETGIGGWSLDQFVAAMREGVAPDGSLYFPIFPYRWYRNLTRDDLAAMKAYLDSLPPVRSEDRPHELLLGLPPGLLRPFVLPWQWINMEDESIPPAQGLLAERGWYLVNALGHCGACHTPALPGYIYEEDRFLGGQEDIPGVYAASNITPDPETGDRALDRRRHRTRDGDRHPARWHARARADGRLCGRGLGQPRARGSRGHGGIPAAGPAGTARHL